MAKMYPMIGAMQMPAGFKYKEILRRGRPSHEKWDSFFIKHPPMAPSRWAKIFAPFDALQVVLNGEVYDLGDGLFPSREAALDWIEKNRRPSILESLISAVRDRFFGAQVYYPYGQMQ